MLWNSQRVVMQVTETMIIKEKNLINYISLKSKPSAYETTLLKNK